MLQVNERGLKMLQRIFRTRAVVPLRVEPARG